MTTVQLKVDFKARGIFVIYLSIEEGDSECGALECSCASVNDLRGCTTDWSSALRDSLLRADWTASCRATNEWAETLRFDRALSPRDGATRATTRFYVRGNPSIVLWFPQCHSGFGALARTVSAKACRTRYFDGRDKNSPPAAQENDARLPLRYVGSMWQRDISQHAWEC